MLRWVANPAPRSYKYPRKKRVYKKTIEEEKTPSPTLPYAGRPNCGEGRQDYL